MMKPEQQNIAIATACGWKNLWVTEVQGWRGDNPDGSGDAFIPDYVNDLNAMHGAERLLTDVDFEFEFESVLSKITYPGVGDPYDPLNKYRGARHRRVIVNATAAQRARAFLKTLGLWEGEK